ncbi:MAG TPA: DMT family transporter [Acidimicrobiales bacterium]|jgi:drug/metabolite transporter (DMT)-like permease|nr:DMT family transporter [Acidimicrobiales bacterium]
MDARSAAGSAPPTLDLALLGLAVVAVSTAAPLVRVADAPTLAVAFWRNALALPVLGLVVAVRSRRELRRLDARERRLSVVAGLFLGAHFATWVPSLSFTSVASSVALVCTQPVWAALIARWRGEYVPRLAWWGIGSAVAGAVVLSGVDLSIDPRALFGDLLAVVGGVLAAAYVTVGAEVRRSVSTSVYALVCYAVAAGALLVICGIGRQPLAGAGYDATTWLALVAMVAGPQLLGHTVVNRVLRTTSPTLVSVAILFEILGSALLAWIAFDEVPPASAVPAALLIGAGVVLVVRAGAKEPAVAGAPALE